MSKNSDYAGRSVATLSEMIGTSLLLLHLYFYCYSLFDRWGLTTKITDRVLAGIVKTGLFNDPFISKGMALVFLLLGVAAMAGRKAPGGSWQNRIVELGVGVLIYRFSSFFWDDDYNGKALYIAYLAVTCLNLLWMLSAASRLMRHIPLPWAKNDPFGKQRSGFPQVQRRLTSAFSLTLRGIYLYKGQHRLSWINLVNPRRGVLILGTPGAGKSYFIIEPLIRQLIEKGMAVFVYDFKYDALTRIAYAHYLANRGLYPGGASFFSINFRDLSRSHRCNVLEPATLHWLSDAMGVSRTILLSLNKTWIHRQGDFFVESPINFLAALIWFLKKYQGGRYCTLPHVVELSKLSYNKLFLVLATEWEIAGLIDPFVQAYANESLEMLDGQIAGAKIPLARLSSPDLYYVLTGGDLGLDINDPKAPKIFCLGGDPNRTEALAPVLSLYIDRLNRICNQPGRHPCAIVCDEFATVRATSVLTTIATGRSNDIITILAVQDISQLRTLYTKDEADWVMAVCGNLFCGQVGGETARMVSERFPRVLQERESVSVNSEDTSVSKHLEWETTVMPAVVANQGSGEFMGVLGDDPDNPLELKVFHAKIVRDEKDRIATVELPVVLEADDKLLQKHYDQVRIDIEGVAAEIVARAMKAVGE